MPDIFEAEEQPIRDRRLAGDTTETSEEVIEKTLSPQEDIPNRSATPLHPERHVGTQNMHIFSSYCERPTKVTFETQEDEEEILLLLRKSFITNIPWIFFSLIFAFVPPILLLIINPATTPLVFLSPGYLFTLSFFYYLV